MNDPPDLVVDAETVEFCRIGKARLLELTTHEAVEVSAKLSEALNNRGYPCGPLHVRRLAGQVTRLEWDTMLGRYRGGLWR